eukprot:4870726-Pyramimonas_sp.AAC.1
MEKRLGDLAKAGSKDKGGALRFQWVMLEGEESTSAKGMLLCQFVESALNQFPGTQGLGASSDKGCAGAWALQSTQ